MPYSNTLNILNLKLYLMKYMEEQKHVKESVEEIMVNGRRTENFVWSHMAFLLQELLIELLEKLQDFLRKLLEKLGRPFQSTSWGTRWRGKGFPWRIFSWPCGWLCNNLHTVLDKFLNWLFYCFGLIGTFRGFKTNGDITDETAQDILGKLFQKAPWETLCKALD